MTWCCQATSHYLSQCSPSSMSPCGITRPQWVNYVSSSDTWALSWAINSSPPSAGGWELQAFLRWWPPSAMWVGGSLNLFMATTGGVWMISSFQIWDYVLHVEHFSCVITDCGQHQWVIPSLLNSSLGFAGGKHLQEITIPIFRHVFKNFAIPDWFPYILFHHYLFSLLSSGWFVIAVCGSVSVRELVKYLGSL